MIDRVTITGADDSVDPSALCRLSGEFPYAEWGILFSGSKQGRPRFPSNDWITKLTDVAADCKLQLSAHLCGKWVRDLLLKANFSWQDNYWKIWAAFQRIQLNFHGQYHKADPLFVGLLGGAPSYFPECPPKEYIFQHDSVNDELIKKFKRKKGIKVFPLFDTSGGAGVIPGEWPKAFGDYCGYAGGLGPDNLKEQIFKIGKAAGSTRIWIDMETKVRSKNDAKFELDKVKKCLEIAQEFVREA